MARIKISKKKKKEKKKEIKNLVWIHGWKCDESINWLPRE